MATALKVERLYAGYHGKNILHGIDLAVPAGGALTIIGPNGSGKSTLLKTLAGLLAVSDGRIELDGRDITASRAPQRARLGLAYVPQEKNIFPNMNISDNLRTSGEFAHRKQSAKTLRARMEQALDLFPELRPHLGKTTGLLSGGQRQMVAMASALMLEPSLLVLDEPSAGLSPRNAGLLFESIARIRGSGITLLMIEQNVKLGLSVADTGLVLVAGQVKLLAPAAELARNAHLHALFLGHAQ
ncbi:MULTISPECIES: ABC transporter ATP-binding protein [Brenneria]|uniref:ABC transporter ATP-binding protein n=1 Tax=Brenneria nigrifluens DSM 30175 = ATCC 13028 TaxID=1121120 RepID=A0A2U1UK67_9GAMM|nr:MULTISPECIES: ABC transporter ATP-binding protein [Brenneria]EHD20398.1 ABC transporter-related protein [Brenneria sp. EniD312]PWC22076.1 ABC transporter ATP-binding protein [Brenneria nigrifluens DSM 30175 = ATCC 13028]QCR03601.1 ABC transporter ATP-binding protein [Brenneria nigrifluens DSM 30175 = ATCC 13028]